MTYLSVRNNYVQTYIPDLTKFVDTGVEAPYRLGTVLRLGNNLYMFGGREKASNNDIANISVASVEDCLSWSDSGYTMPESVSGARICVIDGYLYMFGSFNNNIKINRAELSNPLVWSYTGSSLPTRRDNAPHVMDNSYIYIQNGYNGSAGLASMARASISNPTSWSDLGNITGTLWESTGAVLGNNDVYGFGGVTTTYNIRRVYNLGSSYTNYTNAMNSGITTIPYVWHIGNCLYIIAYLETRELTVVNALNPVKSYIVTETMPYTSGGPYYPYNASWCIDGYVYFINPLGTPVGRIYRSARTVVYAEPAPTNSNRALQAVTAQGIPTTITRSQRIGFPSWWTNRTDLF